MHVSPEKVITKRQIDVPSHLGIILDGNRRWAEQQHLRAVEGHQAGFDNIKVIGRTAFERGVDFFSVYVFSTENWSRSKKEIDYLMRMALSAAKEELREFNDNNIRVRVLGSRLDLKDDLLQAIDNLEQGTKTSTGGTIAFCFNYGGQQEIVDAVKMMVSEGVKAEEVTPEKFAQYLYAPDIPPVDLIIRTSGEQRLSGFMLFRAAYSELLFVDKHWPAFTVDDLDRALVNFATRSRRFGR